MKTLNVFLIILFASTICFAASSMPNSIYNDDGELTARAYIQDGLVNMWDAKENVGWGLHSDTTTVWKDLVGNRDMTITSSTPSDITNQWWTKDGWHVIGTTGKCHGVISSGKLPSSQTIQITLYPTGFFDTTNSEWLVGRILAGYYPAPSIYIYKQNAPSHDFNVYAWKAYESNTTRTFYDPAGTNAYTPFDKHQHTLMHEEDSPNVRYCLDGEIKKIYTIAATSTIQNSDSTSILSIANNDSYNYGIDATYYCIRVYNRVLTDKELAWNYMIDSIRYNLPRKWYPYMNSSWSWADFTDANVLRSDTDGNVPAEIGDSVYRIKNKGGWNSTTWIGNENLQRYDGCVRGKYLDVYRATNVMIRSSANMFTTNDDWNNIEFASMLVTKNERATSTFNTCYILRPNQWKAVMLFWSGATLYYRVLQTNNESIKITGWSESKVRAIDPLLVSIRAKSVNGEYTFDVSLNGSVIFSTNGVMTAGVANNFQPGVMYSSSYPIMSRDYCENLWWNKIPEDWDLIEKTLMLKYNMKPLSYYYPDSEQPSLLLGGGFGSTQPPEEEEPEDIEIEESSE